jgi:hypothetical protein
VNCGHRHEYSFDKPTYCEGCGKPFNKSAVAPSQAAVATPTRKPINSALSRYAGEEDDTPLPQIDKFQVSVETYQTPKITIESARNSPMIGESRPRGTDFNPDDVRKKFADQHKREQNLRREETD